MLDYNTHLYRTQDANVVIARVVMTVGTGEKPSLVMRTCIEPTLALIGFPRGAAIQAGTSFGQQ